MNFNTIPNQPLQPSHAYIEKRSPITIGTSEQPIFPIYNQAAFPTDVFLHILSFLLPKDLVRVSLVCRKWYVLGNEESLWQALEKQIFPTAVFLKDNWKVLGLDGDERILNKRFIISKLRAPCQFKPDKEVWETHKVFEVPKGLKIGHFPPWIINSFRHFLRDYNFVDIPIAETHCVIIKNTPLEKRKGISFEDQQKLVATYPGYEIPNVITAAAFAFNMGQKKRSEAHKELFDETCFKGTCCLEKDLVHQHVEVHYMEDSIKQSFIWIGDIHESLGITPMMRFY